MFKNNVQISVFLPCQQIIVDDYRFKNSKIVKTIDGNYNLRFKLKTVDYGFNHLKKLKIVVMNHD